MSKSQPGRREPGGGGKRESGFTLVELLIAMTIGVIVLIAVSSVFNQQNKSYRLQEEVVEMQQNARAAMDMMTREIRMAGYDPAGTAGAGIVSAASDSIIFTQDLDGDGDLVDGEGWDTNERITYSLYTSDGIQKIGRATGAGNNQPVAEHIQALTFAYYDSNGNTTAVLVDIRQIKVTITARTANPHNGSYSTRTLTSIIIPRNLAY